MSELTQTVALAKRTQEMRRLRHPQKTEKMFTFLRGFCGDKFSPKPETMRALGYMRQRHYGQTRIGGEPYIVHPLSMACFAIGLGLTDDNLIATILLHDVCEDTGVAVADLPANESVKRGVKYMTIQKFPGDKDKNETKRRYFRNLLEDANALVCKAIDRYCNLNDMVGVFPKEKIIKNVVETHELLLPVLKEAKDVYPERANELYVLRTILTNINDNLAIIYGVELYT